MVTTMPLAFLALMLVQLNFGILPIAQKLALHTLTPLALFGIRTVLGASLFFLFYKAWSFRRPANASATKTPTKVYFMLSLLGIALNQFLLIVALTHTTAIATVVVVPSITLFTYGFAIVLKRERFEWSKAVTLLLGGMGVLLLFGEGLLHMIDKLDASIFLGNVLCLISAAVYAYYLVMSRDYVGRQSAVEFTSRMFGAAVVWFTLLLLGSWVWQLTQDPDASLLNLFVHEPTEATHAAFSGFSPQLLGTLGFIVLGPTVINYFLNLWTLKHLPASTVSGFICLQTLIGSTVSYFVLGETIKPTYVVSAFCILSSVLLLSVRSLRAPLRARAQ
jgi:drug/metabolite transporter (DMT)-like permease